MNKNQSIESRCKNKFDFEIETFGSDWRIFSVTTFADLIHIGAIDALRAKEPLNQQDELIVIMNHCVKAMIQKELGKIELIEDINSALSKITLSKKLATQYYKKVFFELSDKLEIINEDLDNSILEIIKYSSYHKKNIASNTKSYFEYIFSLAFHAISLSSR